MMKQIFDKQPRGFLIFSDISPGLSQGRSALVGRKLKHAVLGQVESQPLPFLLIVDTGAKAFPRKGILDFEHAAARGFHPRVKGR